LVGTGYGLNAGQTDTNYAFAVVSGTATGTGGFGVVASPVWPVGDPWVANTATSQWLSPTVDTGNFGVPYDPSTTGQYTWTLTFNLTNYNASTASFSGQWAADNGGTVTLNGTPIGSTSLGFTTWSNFDALSGSGAFNAGQNSLVFTVDNYAGNGVLNPTGIQVRFDSSAVNTVPEPGEWALMLAGLGMMGFIVRRRQTHNS
jgi:hypothetical protein